MTKSNTSGRARRALMIAVLLTVALYVLPFGRFLAGPLIWFSTFAHEMGHGLAAVLVGGEFKFFKMWPGGSGVAQHAGASGRLAGAFISAGGLLGPAILAAIFFWMGRRARLAKIALSVFAVGSLIAFVVVVRNPFGWAFVGALAAASGFLALRGSAVTSQVSLVFLAIQLSLSVFSRGDYLFTEVAKTGQGTQPSDVAHISQALFLPYWFWGGLIALFSVLVLVVGLVGFLKTATADWHD